MVMAVVFFLSLKLTFQHIVETSFAGFRFHSAPDLFQRLLMLKAQKEDAPLHARVYHRTGGIERQKLRVYYLFFYIGMLLACFTERLPYPPRTVIDLQNLF